MDTQIIVVFCLCADMLTALHHYEDRQRQMSDAEVMTTAIVAISSLRATFAWPAAFYTRAITFRICYARAASIAACITSPSCS